MKKFLWIIVLGLIWCNISFASEVCEKEKKYSQAWYYNNCDGNTLQSTDQKPIKSYLNELTLSIIDWLFVMN